MDGVWESPLKKKKEAKPPPPPPTRDELKAKVLKEWKKKKCVISPGAARKILAIKFADSFICDWVVRWIETCVASNNYPPQLVSNGFSSLLRTYFASDKAFAILAQIRREFRVYFPSMDEAEEKEEKPDPHETQPDNSVSSTDSDTDDSDCTSNNHRIRFRNY